MDQDTGTSLVSFDSSYEDANFEKNKVGYTAAPVACGLACSEMTKTKKIKILQAVHVVELSWASIVIIFSFKSLRLGCRALP